MQVSSKSVLYAFRPDLEPVAHVQSGDLVTFETIDALGGQLQDESDTLDGLDFSKVNPATGPVAIEGAVPGDALKIEILQIQVAEKGIILAVPGLGVLGNSVKEPQTRIVPIRENLVQFGQLRLPINPMIGVIGVATQQDEIPCGTPGHHGGNMDTKEICAGNTLYLPVFQPGGQLALGDVHAAMGDGEICGTGVECAAQILLRVTLCKEMPLNRPLLETADEIQCIASAATIEEASRLACNDMIAYLQQSCSLSFNDAYMLISIAGNVRISQLVDPLLTVRLAIPKSVLAQCQ